MGAAKPSKLTSLYTLFVILLPILSIYAVPGLGTALSLGELVIILLLPFMIYEMRLFDLREIIKNPFCGYLLYALISTLIATALLVGLNGLSSVGSMITRLVRDAFYMMMIVFFGRVFFDIKKAIKIIKIIAILLSLFIFAQFLLYQLFGFYLTGFVPGVKTTISGGEISNVVAEHFEKTASLDGYVRAHGFMSEPAAAAHFLSLALLVYIFPTEGKKVSFAGAIICSAGMLLTFSVNAFVALSFCWLIWLLFARKKAKEVIITVLILFGVALFVLPFLIANNFLQDILARIVSMLSGGSTQNSAAVRVIRGPAFFLAMPLLAKIFGSGFGNFDSFKEIFSINTPYEQEGEYLSTNSYVAISSGIIGFCLYVYGIWKMASKRQWLSKSVALLIFLYGMSSSIYSSGIFVIMLLVVFNCPKKGESL